MMIKVSCNNLYISISCLPDWFTIVHTFKYSQQASMLLNMTCYTVQITSSYMTRKLTPGFKSLSCCSYCSVYVLLFSLHCGGQFLSYKVYTFFLIKQRKLYRLEDVTNLIHRLLLTCSSVLSSEFNGRQNIQNR